MKHRAAVIVMAVLPFATSTACECPPPIEGVTNFSRAETVFVGVPISVQESTPLGPTRRVRIRVVESLKGPNRTVATVFTPAQVSACGINFLVGKKYLIYSVASPKGSLVYHCEGTKPLDAAALREIAEIKRSLPDKAFQTTR